MTSWIRRRFDSAESDDIPESPEPNDDGTVMASDVKTSLCFESETDGNVKSRVTKVKTQWQRAVRKLSVNSSGYGSASNEPSPAISLSGSRASMEKPAWLLKQQQLCQPRSRHMSINADSDQRTNVTNHRAPAAAQAAIPIPEGRPMPNITMPSSLPPYYNQRGFTPEPRICDKSRTPSGGSEESAISEENDDNQFTEEFPYGPAFRAAMGRITTFPDGTEAVMIDSAVALEAFREDQMVKLNS